MNRYDRQKKARLFHKSDVSLERMMSRLEERMDKTGGGVIDMPFLPRVSDGIIRCYMFRSRCRGILHQLPLKVSDGTSNTESSLYPNLNVSKSKKYQTSGLPEGKCVHSPNSPQYHELVKTIENDWVPKIAKCVGLLPNNMETNSHVSAF